VIEDNGQGIPEIQLKRILEPFYTTKPSGKGTGLGLFVSYGIIQKMNGQLEVQSVEGQGTIVEITLPNGS
jgi:signal transduction histidine kinase